MTIRRGWTLAAALFAVALSLTANPHASAQTVNDQTITVKWKTTALVHITLTPNYYTGFGQVPAIIGTQPAPTHGPGATGVGTGSVDFGSVLAGKNYLYKYAVHVNVSSSDPTGVNVYGEGAVNFINTADGSTYPIQTSIYYLNSTSGSPADPNTGFSASVPFQFTSGVVTGGGSPASPPTIAYASYPAPIAQSSTANSDFYWDYQLHVPATASTGDYYSWVVYTVIGK